MTKPTHDRSERLAEAHADLVAAVESLTSGDDWQRMLDVAARFHHYSANNVFLIMMQRPDSTQVAGYRAWQGLNRQVRKGEKGIRILAPCKFRYATTDDEGQETIHIGIRGFTTVSVFDVAQTDGEELPDMRPTLLDGGDAFGLWDALATQVQAAGFRIERGECRGANGSTNHAQRTVRVRDDVSDAQAAKTLCHELAHVILHTSTEAYFRCRGVCEVEAESVAHLVCQAAGLTTDAYSWPYVALWAEGKSEVVRETADRVIMTARSILDAISAQQMAEVA